jgi:hypothetical protein
MYINKFLSLFLIASKKFKMTENDELKEKLKIIVKTLTGAKHNFNVNYGDKLIDLKIRLVKNETKKLLSNDEDLIGSVLKSGDEVILVIQLRGC